MSEVVLGLFFLFDFAEPTEIFIVTFKLGADAFHFGEVGKGLVDSALTGGLAKVLEKAFEDIATQEGVVLGFEDADEEIEGDIDEGCSEGGILFFIAGSEIEQFPILGGIVDYEADGFGCATQAVLDLCEEAGWSPDSQAEGGIDRGENI